MLYIILYMTTTALLGMPCMFFCWSYTQNLSDYFGDYSLDLLSTIISFMFTVQQKILPKLKNQIPKMAHKTSQI